VFGPTVPGAFLDADRIDQCPIDDGGDLLVDVKRAAGMVREAILKRKTGV
jgi:hypothetical protein